MSQNINEGRRRVLGTAAMVAAAAQLSMTALAGAHPYKDRKVAQDVPRRPGSAETNATVVLVQGAWADGSSWARVITPLQGEGLKTIAAPIPLTSLSDDVAALERVLERTD
jgi:hypothetical protein